MAAISAPESSFGADVLLGVDDQRLAGVVAVAPPLRVLPAEAAESIAGSATRDDQRERLES